MIEYDWRANTSRIAVMPNCPSCNSTNSPGTMLCRSCGASIPESAPTTTALDQEVRSLLDQGKKIEAVKVYRERTGSSLRDAKDAVEALQGGASQTRTREPDANLESEVLRVPGQGEKIKAVKLYKDRTGATLYDSKQAVEAIAERHGITVDGGGCSGVLVMLIVALIAIAIVAALLILRQ